MFSFHKFIPSPSSLLQGPAEQLTAACRDGNVSKVLELVGKMSVDVRMSSVGQGSVGNRLSSVHPVMKH
jgi:hypothetical protein